MYCPSQNLSGQRSKHSMSGLNVPSIQPLQHAETNAAKPCFKQNKHFAPMTIAGD